jgi:hypothetical protein
MANANNASGKSKKNYLNPISDQRNVFNIHCNKDFGSTYIWDLSINTIFHIPTKKVVSERGKEDCWVCIQRGISDAMEDWKKWGRVRYSANESILIRYDDFEKMKGEIPRLNQSPKPTNWN